MIGELLMYIIRILTALMLGYTTLVSAFTSSIFSTATRTIAAQYHVSTEVGLLGLSFYVLGFAIGPVFWAPLSELKGRRLPLVISMFGFTIFQVAVAAGKDLQTILLSRFWGGTLFPDFLWEFTTNMVLIRYLRSRSSGCCSSSLLRYVR